MPISTCTASTHPHPINLSSSLVKQNTEVARVKHEESERDGLPTSRPWDGREAQPGRRLC